MKKFISLFSFVLAIILSLGTLVACGGSEPPEGESGEISIRYWYGFTGEDGTVMDSLVNSFNEEYKGQIKISTRKMGWDDLFTNLYSTSANVKSAPHIVAMSNQRFAGAVNRKLVLKINDIVSAIGANESEYLSSAWNAGIIDGDRYSFPLDVHPTAMFYNKALISESELPKTWEEFRSVCKTKTGNGVYGCAIPNVYSITKDLFSSYLMQKGGELLDSDFNPAFNSSYGKTSLQYFYDLIYSDQISPSSVSSGGDQTLFGQGRSVFYFDGPWLLNTFNMIEGNGRWSNIDVGVAPMPGSTGDNGTSLSGSHQITLMAKTVTTDSVKNACYTFVKYLQDHAIDWAKAGQVPAKKAVYDMAQYKEITALAPFTQEALKAGLGRSSYKYFYECYNYAGSAVASALNKTMSVADALDNMAQQYRNFVLDDEL